MRNPPPLSPFGPPSSRLFALFDAEDRERLLGALLDLCEAKARAGSLKAQEATEALFLRLLKDADASTRRKLARRAAREAFVPARFVAALGPADAPSEPSSPSDAAAAKAGEAFERAPAPAAADGWGAAPRPAPAEASAPRPARASSLEDAKERLVADLRAAGRLKPAALVRILREGDLDLFETALASLADLDRAAVKSSLRSRRPELLALACRAVGLERADVQIILSLVGQSSRPAGTLGAGEEAAVAAAFALGGGAEAAQAFRAAVVADRAAPAADRPV